MKSSVRAVYKNRRGFNLALSLFAAGLLTTMLTAQLYTFEEMPLAVQNVLPYMSDSSAAALVGVMAALQLAALAYLLPLALSRLARALAAVALVGVNTVWVGVLVYALLTGAPMSLVPVLGVILDELPWLIVIKVIGLLVASSIAVLYLDHRQTRS